MALELVYTSAARGLREGTSGFCTVAMTRGLPMTMVPRLEALGGYRPGPRGDGPVALSFWRLETAHGVVSVLARVGPAAPDHTQRSNKLATYVVLGTEEQCEAGPAWLLQHLAMRDTWTGPPQWLEAPVAVPPQGAQGAVVCRTWERACGDAGWAGVLASAFLRDMGRPAHVIYREGTDPLQLIDEASRLLPPWAKWRATFSTYFVQPVAGAPCCWRFCLEGTAAAEAARASKGLLIDLTRPLTAAPDSRHVRAARSGVLEAADGTEEPPVVHAGHAAGGNGTELWAGRSNSPSWASPHQQGAHESGDIQIEESRGERGTSWAASMAARLARERAHSASGAGDPPKIQRISPGAMAALIAGGVTIFAVVIIAWSMSGGGGNGGGNGGGGNSGGSDGSAKELPHDVPHDAPKDRPKTAQANPNEHPVNVPSATQFPVSKLPEKTLTDSPGDAPVKSVEPTVPAVPTAPTDVPKPPDSPSDTTSNPSDAPQVPSPDAPASTSTQWIVLGFIPGESDLTARAAVPSSLQAVAARPVLPAAFQGAGVRLQDNQLVLPGSAGAVQATLAGGTVSLSIPVRGNDLELLASVIKLPVNAPAVEFARALLRRIPIELLDASGAVVARARVEPARTAVLTSKPEGVRHALVVAEPALQLDAFMETKLGERKPMGTSVAARGQTAEFKLPWGDATVQFEGASTLLIKVPVHTASSDAERARLMEEFRAWKDKRDAAATLQKRLGGQRVPDNTLAAAVATVQSAMNDDERALMKDSKGVVRSFLDPDVLRQVVPAFMARCNHEMQKNRDASAALGSQGDRAADALAIDVVGQDGMVLTTIYPEGRPR